MKFCLYIHLSRRTWPLEFDESKIPFWDLDFLSGGATTHPRFADTLGFEALTGEATELKLALRQPYDRLKGVCFSLSSGENPLGVPCEC